MGVRRAKSTQGNTNCQKNIFEDDEVPVHHPRALRHDYRARNGTFEENHFWSLLKVPFKTDLLVKTV